MEGIKMADTKIDLEPYDNVDLKSYSDKPTMYEEGTIGTIGMEDEPDHEETSQKMKEETHGDKDSSNKGPWLGFLSVEYYQPYFDVTTSDVIYRVIAGMLPFPFKLSSTISSSPDLYGPFWLCMTLIFTTAISGNISALISGNNEWEFHFHEVIVIATVVYIYTWCLPVILWLFLVWRNVSDRYSLIKMQSIYGYSMAIFIPLTLLWVINVEVLRWLILVVAIGLSGAVLVQALWSPLQNETKQIALALLAVVFLLHAGIAVGFKFYYFNSSLTPDVTVIEPHMLHVDTPIPSVIQSNTQPSAMSNSEETPLAKIDAKSSRRGQIKDDQSNIHNTSSRESPSSFQDSQPSPRGDNRVTDNKGVPSDKAVESDNNRMKSRTVENINIPNNRNQPSLSQAESPANQRRNRKQKNDEK